MRSCSQLSMLVQRDSRLPSPETNRSRHGRAYCVVGHVSIKGNGIIMLVKLIVPTKPVYRCRRTVGSIVPSVSPEAIMDATVLTYCQVDALIGYTRTLGLTPSQYTSQFLTRDFYGQTDGMDGTLNREDPEDWARRQTIVSDFLFRCASFRLSLESY